MKKCDIYLFFSRVCKKHISYVYCTYKLICFLLLGFILYGVYLPTRAFFTHLETSQLTVKGCIFFYLCSALMTIEQQESTSTVTLGIRLKWSSPKTCHTQIYLRAFRNGAVTAVAQCARVFASKQNVGCSNHSRDRPKS